MSKAIVFPRLKSRFQHFLLMLLICFPQMSETIYTPSLPDVASTYSITSNLTQWTLSIYFIGFALGVAFWGLYSDYVGRKKAISRGCFIYFLGCLGCFFSLTINSLLVCRLVQAFGISIGSVVVQSILRECFKGESLSRIFASINIFMALSPALGIFIGGYLTDWFGWRSNFIALILFIALLYGLINYFLDETNRDIGKKISFSCIKKVFLSMSISYRSQMFALLVGLFNGIMFSYYSHAPFVFTYHLHLGASEYGNLGVFPAIGVIIGSLLSKRFRQKSNEIKVLKIGCYGTLISIILLNINAVLLIPSFEKTWVKVGLFLFPMAVFFVFFSIAIPQLLSGAVKEFRTWIGTASSIFGLIYYIYTSFFNFLMGYFDNGKLTIMPFYFLSLSCLIVIVLVLFSHMQCRQKQALALASLGEMNQSVKNKDHFYW